MKNQGERRPVGGQIMAMKLEMRYGTESYSSFLLDDGVRLLMTCELCIMAWVQWTDSFARGSIDRRGSERRAAQLMRAPGDSWCTYQHDPIRYAA